MKQKLLIIALIICGFSFGRNNDNKPPGPAIGVILYGNFINQGTIQFQISIKNYGDEPLTNIYVTNTENPQYNITILTNPSTATNIPSLSPGEENNVTFYGNSFSGCLNNLFQIKVHATTSAGAEIIDYSDANSYYGNDVTPVINFYLLFNAYQDGIYEDLNANNIIDVGDAVNYTYHLTGGTPAPITITDNNAIVISPTTFSSDYTTTGKHYLTAAEVSLGYVFNTSSFSIATPCGESFVMPFIDLSDCLGCPHPSNVNIVTKLTSQLPNIISGNVKFNVNSDNCATGLNYPRRRITSTSGGFTYSSYTNDSGNYSIFIPNNGTFSTTANQNLNANLTSNPSAVSVTSAGENINYATTNFCISSATNYTDLTVGLFPQDNARPGFSSSYKIWYQNNGSTNLNGSIVLTYENGKMTFSSATPATNASTSNTLTWNYTNLLPFQRRYIYVSFTVAAPPTVNSGDSLNFTVVGNPIVGDNSPTDNTYILSQNVFSSFDPNDKTVLEGATISLSQASRYLHYVTRFQNTGTANATTVVLKETLDPKLDWTTFEPLDASHTYNIQIRNGNELTITFSTINLPYSSANEAASHGYFAYRIKPRNTVVVGDSFSSNAKIYFDYNPFIQTNTVNTTITALANADFENHYFSIAPNPVNDYFVVKSDYQENLSYQITDLNGKLLSKGKVENDQPISISEFQKGFYFITLSSESEKQTFKIIKQ